MPKFTYSASKGIEQSSGQGFFVQDVPVSPSSEAIADGNAASDLSGLGVVTFDSNGTSITLEDGVAVGQQKVIIITGTGGSGRVYLSDGATGITGLDQTNLATGNAYIVVWTGSAWKLLS